MAFTEFWVASLQKIYVFILCIGTFLFSVPETKASQVIQVFAASSLTKPFTALATQFEKAHPGVKIHNSFLASSKLATQIKEGAPADIFVSASAEEMKGIAHGIGYVTNEVVLAVPVSSTIKRISNLNKGAKWIRCAAEVPCGAATDAGLKSENIVTRPVSLEPNASSTLAKLLAQEVDAAFLYKTDVQSNSSILRAIHFTNKTSATTKYVSALLTKNRLAALYYATLRSSSSIKLLISGGFGAP